MNNFHVRIFNGEIFPKLWYIRRLYIYIVQLTIRCIGSSQRGPFTNITENNVKQLYDIQAHTHIHVWLYTSNLNTTVIHTATYTLYITVHIQHMCTIYIHF